MQTISQIIVQILVYAPIILSAVILHELGHAWMSVWMGDPTPREDGRLTFNPFHHFDAGSLFFLMISGIFGGLFLVARPVQIAPQNYRFPVISELLVSMAGPFMNFLSAFVLWPLILLLGWLIPTDPVYRVFFWYCLAGVKINLYIGLLNLLPVPPLDGSYLWLSWFSYRRFTRFRDTMSMYGTWCLLFVFVALLVVPNHFLRDVLRWTDRLSQDIVKLWKIIKMPAW